MASWRRMVGWPVLLVLAAAVPARAASEDEARVEMVRIVELEAKLVAQAAGLDEIDPRVLAVMRQVPRHLFVPEPLRAYAYGNHPLPVGYEQNIADPLLVALMTDLVQIEPDDVVYETGTGAGYHAAVLSLLAAEVVSVEVVAPLAERAKRLLAELGYHNVQVEVGDGYDGWPARAPFAAIIVKEAIDHVPVPLLAQLARGGRMVLPLGPTDGTQMLTVITKDTEGRLAERPIMPVRFSPFQGGRHL